MEQLSVRKTEILLQTMNYEKPVRTYKLSGLEVCSLDGNDFIELPEVFTQHTIPVNRLNIPSKEDIKQWPYLDEVKLKFIGAEVNLLIGVNVPKAMEPLKVINSQDNGPYAVLTHLGWIVNGPLGISSHVDKHGRPQIMTNRISVARLEDLPIQKHNQNFPELTYRTENSFEDKKFLEIMKESICKRDGHYEIRLPFRREDVCMPNNRQMAEQRAQSLKRRFERDESFKNDTVCFMNDVLQKGHAEMVPEEQLPRSDGECSRVLHHRVYHKRKKTIRVVFDCTSSYQGTSLNTKLLQDTKHTSAKCDKVLQSVKSEPTDLQLSVQDLTDAEESLVTFVQQQAFRD